MIKKTTIAYTAATILFKLFGNTSEAMSQEVSQEEISAALTTQSAQVEVVDATYLSDCEGFGGKPAEFLCDGDTSCTEVPNGYKCLNSDDNPADFGFDSLIAEAIEDFEKSRENVPVQQVDSNPVDPEVVMEGMAEEQVEPVDEVKVVANNNLNITDYVMDGVLTLGDYSIRLQEGEEESITGSNLYNMISIVTNERVYGLSGNRLSISSFDVDEHYVDGQRVGCNTWVGICVGDNDTIYINDSDGNYRLVAKDSAELSAKADSEEVKFSDDYLNKLANEARVPSAVEFVTDEPIADENYQSTGQVSSEDQNVCLDSSCLEQTVTEEKVEQPVDQASEEIEVIMHNGNTPWEIMFGSGNEPAVEQNYNSGEQSSSQSDIRSIECDGGVCNDSLEQTTENNNGEISSQVVPIYNCDDNGCPGLESEVSDSQVPSSRICEGKDCLDETVQQVAEPQEVPKAEYEAAIDQAVVEPQDEQPTGDYVVPGNLISESGLSKKFTVSIGGEEYRVDISMSVLGNSVKGREGYVYPGLMAKGIDTNRDGALSVEELSNMAQSDGCPVCATTAERLYEAHPNGIEALTVEAAVGRAACNGKAWDTGFGTIPCVEQYKE
jgi:hypothetical protein